MSAHVWFLTFMSEKDEESHNISGSMVSPDLAFIFFPFSLSPDRVWMSCWARISHLDGTSLYGSLETVPENDQIAHACFAGCAVSARMTQVCPALFQKFWLYVNEGALHMKVGIRESLRCLGGGLLTLALGGGWSHRRPGQGTSSRQIRPSQIQKSSIFARSGCGLFESALLWVSTKQQQKQQEKPI